MKMDYQEFLKQAGELEEYAKLDDSEWGEAMMALCQLGSGRIVMLSEEFYDAVAKEIADNLEYVREHTEIVEEDETITRKIKQLEWH